MKSLLRLLLSAIALQAAMPRGFAQPNAKANETAAAAVERKQGNDAAKDAFRRGNAADALAALDTTKDKRNKATPAAVQESQRLGEIGIELLNADDKASASLVAQTARQRAQQLGPNVPAKDRAKVLFQAAQLVEHTSGDFRATKKLFEDAAALDPSLAAANEGAARMAALETRHRVKAAEYDILKQRADTAAKEKAKKVEGKP